MNVEELNDTIRDIAQGLPVDEVAVVGILLALDCMLMAGFKREQATKFFEGAVESYFPPTLHESQQGLH